jgi:hypothetical protein
MSAVKIILKRSSIYGKRPSNAVLEAGELGLNTNSADPGLFFETTSGDVVKVGPVSTGAVPPIAMPEKGEQWYNTIERTLSIGTLTEAKKAWQTIAAPFLGGGGFVVFVAPEFEYSSDSLANDGQTLPYQTVTRAIIELSKISIQNSLNGITKTGENTRYTVFVAPSRVTANNGLGKNINNFSVDFSSDPLADVTIEQLVQFNAVDGGIIVPRGISIVGMDLRKCEIRPTYVPTYLNPTVPAGTVNQPLSSIFKWSGNSYVNNFSATDKLSYREVYKVTTEGENPQAIFNSIRPHGLAFNETVQVRYSPTVDQSVARPASKVTFAEETYYAYPIDTFKFYLATAPFTEATVSLDSFVLASTLPVLSDSKTPKLLVANTLQSAHRLALLRNVSMTELADYYVKIQKAFSSYFGGRVVPGMQLVSEGEYQIVAPAESPWPTNLTSNQVDNSSPYANQVTVRSQYGMGFGDFDGNTVSGFKSVLLNECTCVSLQNDPSAYEIYGTFTTPDAITTQKWWLLTEAAWLSIPPAQRPELATQVPVAEQLQLLNATSIQDIRYYYTTEKSADGLSYGIVDVSNDFRHFGFRARNGAYAQGVELFTIGPAIGVWALNGGNISLTNSTSNFGSIAFKSEGFLGINTLGGAYENGKNFFFNGIQVPLSLTNTQVENDDNKQIYPLGGRVTRAYLDPTDPSVQLIDLSTDFFPCYILPYSLRPGSAVWVSSGTCGYRAFFATDGGPTVITGSGDPVINATLRVRASDSTIPNTDNFPVEFGIPYIRRFRDPRDPFERSYSFYMSSTSFNTISPPIGSVMRLNQSLNTIASVLPNLKPNVQLDPGNFGGWGRVFTVDDVLPASLGTSPRFNYVIGDVVQDSEYFVIATVTDFSRPWQQTYNSAAGSYSTFEKRNWYSAENDMWQSVYYDTNFSATVGPEKIAPTESCSPFVSSSVLERQEPVADAYQSNFSPDPLRDTYLDQTYFRGATVPYTEAAPQDYYDNDDGTIGMGLLLTDVFSGVITRLTSQLTTIQTEQQPSLTPSPGVRYRPEIVTFSVQQPSLVTNPKEDISIIKLTSPAGYEYLRVIGINHNRVTAIRLNQENSFYPSPTNTTWAQNNIVEICILNTVPEKAIYDPDWSNTKRSVIRFFEVMGYSPTITNSFLQPHWWGERIVPVTTLPLTPARDGYAVTTSRWPLEFNQASTIQANMHTWVQCGYLNYSRGLPEYQSTNLPNKQHMDFLATTLWGGRLTVAGVADDGELVLLGSQREALTARYYGDNPNYQNLDSQQIYTPQPYIEFPAPILVYALDDISDQFDGTLQTFQVTKGGLVVPPSQLVTASSLVQLGAVVQKPSIFVSGAWTAGAYWFNESASEITFVEAPLAGTTCEIRIMTSDDNENTLLTLQYELAPGQVFDGTQTVYTILPINSASKSFEITTENTFVLLGGVEQIPISAYGISKAANSAVVTIQFASPPLAGTTLDVRTVTSGLYFANQGTYPVEVYSFDNIEPLFDSVRTEFPLTYNTVPVNSSIVNSENIFVSLGGAIQLPPQEQIDPVTFEPTPVPGAYVVSDGKITFVQPPQIGTTCNMRFFGEREFISCPLPGGLSSSFMKWGPGVVLSLQGNMEALDSGLI